MAKDNYSASVDRMMEDQQPKKDSQLLVLFTELRDSAVNLY